jgi:MoxR-like ATPase
VAVGASPRAAQALGVAARARALLHGRNTVELPDVVSLAPDIVRHRLVLNYHATAEGVRAVDVVRRLMVDHFETGETDEGAEPSFWRRLLGRA